MGEKEGKGAKGQMDREGRLVQFTGDCTNTIDFWEITTDHHCGLRQKQLVWHRAIAVGGDYFLSAPTYNRKRCHLS